MWGMGIHQSSSVIGGRMKYWPLIGLKESHTHLRLFNFSNPSI